ncbi:PREDICTED: uncharacterized aarF domain-containing protein kinase 2-like [Amphimedon queenslandica]|uniref:ABC1 atypical kinase-like domain-containing protein n=1 Tax=Amphimedon queenslandica TaxID=400682 RepID=A0AAN0IQF9_AMPQE|nr:PREDICTED: uncharacterized aarF domain-containing protein kinase 2-like [Amphimedon queenslandica]|eukprot:XP_011406621.2 PREDICTED: uncharacterized aarF domain-containing protein kinase 2-like [Amphimedon queenslandica]
MSTYRFFHLRLVQVLLQCPAGISPSMRCLRTLKSYHITALKLQGTLRRYCRPRVLMVGTSCSAVIGSMLILNNNRSVHCIESKSGFIDKPIVIPDGSFNRLIVVFRLFYLGLLFSPVLLCHVIEILLPLRFILSLKWSLLLFSIERAGPAFIKLGQWASTRPDIFSESTCAFLSQLQRDCTPHSWDATKQTLEDSFGPQWEDMFTRYDHTPIGSGCIAQVYKWDLSTDSMQCSADAAVKANGGSLPVAVKVVHPGVVGSVLRDVYLMETVAWFVDRVFPSVYWISLRECVDEFGIVMKKQLDLKAEAVSMDQFRKNFKSHKHIKIPQPIHTLVTNSVLVETFEEGVHISQYVKESEQTSLKKRIASLGIDVLLNMLFVHNFVHCDMHPGNLLVQTDPSVGGGGDPSLVLLDCGVTASLNNRDWDNLHQLFLAIVKKEGGVVADLMLSNASTNACTDVDSYRKEMKALVTSATEQLNLSTVKAGPLLSNLCKVLIKHKVKLESNFASVMLAVMVVEGLGRSLDPQLDILAAATPFLLRKAAKDSLKTLMNKEKDKYN